MKVAQLDRLGVRVGVPDRFPWVTEVVPAKAPVCCGGVVIVVGMKPLKKIPVLFTKTVPVVLDSPVPIAVAKADPEINTKAPATMANLRPNGDILNLLIFFYFFSYVSIHSGF